MKINDFRGELIDGSAKEEALLTTLPSDHALEQLCYMGPKFGADARMCGGCARVVKHTV